ncbi:MAG: hypothetical protein NT159_10280 [Proteobacteria bacterium]|nr:hypothetical protein [Pseudomonadota bacterium]
MTDSQTRGFDTEAGYAAAIDVLLAATHQDVCVFDNDLARMGLEQPARCEMLARILASRRDSRLRIVLHEPGPLERGSPRLLNLLQRHAEIMEVRRSPKPLRHLADCFLLGDARHGVVRFHARQPRGKFFLDDVEAAQPWQQRFDELWEAAIPCLPPTRLGL